MKGTNGVSEGRNFIREKLKHEIVEYMAEKGNLSDKALQASADDVLSAIIPNLATAFIIKCSLEEDKISSEEIYLRLMSILEKSLEHIILDDGLEGQLSFLAKEFKEGVKIRYNKI